MKKEVFLVNLYKLILFVGFWLSLLCFGKEIPALDFWVCQSERAEGVFVRSLRIHEFKEKKSCLVIYNTPVDEKVLIEDQWLGSCQRALQDKKKELENNLWNCEVQPLVYVFYPAKTPPSY